MISQLSWKIGGQQGEGVESTDRIFSTALNRLGYYLYGYRHFSSRIKGGHTNNKIRISTKPIRAISDDLDILVAFDQETIDLNSHELRKGGVVVADAKFNPTMPEGIDAKLFAVPITSIAEELGTSLFKNMVASGASWALLGPLLFEQRPDFAWGLISSMYIGNVITVIAALLIIPFLMHLIRIPSSVMLPIITVICIIGAYSFQNNMFDVWVMLIAGVVAYFLNCMKYPIAPLLLSFVLTPMFEQAVRQSFTLSGGSLSIFVSSPITITLNALIVLFIVSPMFMKLFRKTKIDRTIAK